MGSAVTFNKVDLGAQT